MIQTRPDWDPEQYRRFERDRDRPARELLARIPADLTPSEIWDLGCGAGQHAALLKRRHAEARVHGLDVSDAMLEQARARRDDVDWRQGDIAGWEPDAPIDLIFSNAALHWLPDHETLLRRLTGFLAAGGVIAVQMPIAYETRHHGLMREVAAEGPWGEALKDARPVMPLLTPEAYYAVLAEACDDVDVWSTTYLQALTGPDAVLEWMKGTSLRPFLTALSDESMRQAYLAALGVRLSEAFPRRADGVTLMPFPRLFLMARKR